MKRSKWKGFYVKPIIYKDLEKSVQKIPRNSLIVPKFIEQTFKVHNGKIFKNVTVLKEMLHHKFGEFVKTRIPFEYKKRKKKK
jgi:small subunit ribosomal protein S19